MYIVLSIRIEHENVTWSELNMRTWFKIKPLYLDVATCYKSPPAHRYFPRYICSRVKAWATSLQWPTATARAVSAGHFDGVAPARAWSPSCRPTTLVKIIHWPIAGSGCCLCMFGRHLFNRCWCGTCMDVVVATYRDRRGWTPWSSVKTLKTLGSY